MRTEDGYVIHKCLNGDSAAFGFLVDKYKASIYAFAYSRLGNFHDAEDVAQEVFIKAYENLRKLKRWDSFLAWLYSITSNLCKMWIRAQSRRPDSEFVEDQDVETLESPSRESYRDGLARQSLHEVLDSLPEMYSQVLTLHYLGGMSSMEMARFLGASPAAIRKRLSKARSLLKEEMIAMMSTTFEGQRLQATFTFRIVEAVKRLKIHPMPRANGMPWGLSVVTGVVITVLSLSPHLSILNPIAIPAGLPLPVETKVLKTGDIPVDILKTSEISVIANKQGDSDGGEPQFQMMNNSFMLAPQAETGKWTDKADMPTARSLFSTCTVNGRIYAIGGIDAQQQRLSAVEEYDPATDTWMQRTNMPTPRLLDQSLSAVNGKIYAIGGHRAGGNALSTVEEYDPETDTWMKKANMPTGRAHFPTCVVNGKIYAVSGKNTGTGFTSAVEEYDPETDTWTRKANIPTLRARLDAAVVNGKIYAIGGYEKDWSLNGSTLSTVEEYDPVTDTWTRKADMPTARGALSVCAVDGKIYAIGGWSTIHKEYVLTVEEYDPATDTWRQLSDISFGRECPSCSAVNGKIYTIGGWVQGGVTSAVEEYDPEFVGVEATGKLPTKWGKIKVLPLFW